MDKEDYGALKSIRQIFEEVDKDFDKRFVYVLASDFNLVSGAYYWLKEEALGGEDPGKDAHCRFLK